MDCVETISTATMDITTIQDNINPTALNNESNHSDKPNKNPINNSVNVEEKREGVLRIPPIFVKSVL